MKHSLRSRQRFSNRVISLFVKSPETRPPSSARCPSSGGGGGSVGPVFRSHFFVTPAPAWVTRSSGRVSPPPHVLCSRRRVDDLLHTRNKHTAYNVASQTKLYSQLIEQQKKHTRASDNTVGLRRPLDEIMPSKNSSHFSFIELHNNMDIWHVRKFCEKTNLNTVSIDL